MPLPALGLSLLLGIMGIINVAHSAFIMLGAFFASECSKPCMSTRLFPLRSRCRCFCVVGMLVFRLMIVRMERAEQDQGLVAMFGLMVLIENRRHHILDHKHARGHRRL